MTTLLQQITVLIDEPTADRDRVNRTLTDGYAQALLLETERLQMQKRIVELTDGLGRGNDAVNAKELAALARQVDGNAEALVTLRTVLADLRRARSSS